MLRQFFRQQYHIFWQVIRDVVGYVGNWEDQDTANWEDTDVNWEDWG